MTVETLVKTNTDTNVRDADSRKALMLENCLTTVKDGPLLSSPTETRVSLVKTQPVTERPLLSRTPSVRRLSFFTSVSVDSGVWCGGQGRG